MTANQLTIDVLERWVLLGAQWRVVDLSDQRAVVDLCNCTGETVERLRSEDPSLISYVRTATDPGPEPRSLGVTEIRGPYYSVMGSRYLTACPRG
jgi:hypothetical protein